MAQSSATRTDERLSIRASATQKRTLRQAASARHMNVSQFVLQASLDEATRVIAEETIVRLSPEEYQTAIEVMDAPVSEMPRLRNALQECPVWNA